MAHSVGDEMHPSWSTPPFEQLRVPHSLHAASDRSRGRGGVAHILIATTEANVGKIGRITTAGVYTEFTLPSGSNSLPIQINAGPDGNVWWVEANTSNIGRITPAGVITEFPTPTAASNPNGIVAASDGDMYATEVVSSKIARFNPSKP